MNEKKPPEKPWHSLGASIDTLGSHHEIMKEGSKEIAFKRKKIITMTVVVSVDVGPDGDEDTGIDLVRKALLPIALSRDAIRISDVETSDDPDTAKFQAILRHK